MPVATAQVQGCPGNAKRPASSLPNNSCTASPRLVQSCAADGSVLRCRTISIPAFPSESGLSRANATNFQRRVSTAPAAPRAAFTTRYDLRGACTSLPPHDRSVCASSCQQIGPRPLSAVSHQRSVPSCNASTVSETHAFTNTNISQQCQDRVCETPTVHICVQEPKRMVLDDMWVLYWQSCEPRAKEQSVTPSQSLTR
jgi:hypothetical protein